MPLRKGRSKKVISQNIAELMHAYKGKGKIGAYHPESARKAMRAAVAIAYRKAGRSRRRSR